jgi:hypothetical protein
MTDDSETQTDPHEDHAHGWRLLALWIAGAVGAWLLLILVVWGMFVLLGAIS